MLYSPLYTTASLPMMLGPKARALSYLVPTKYLFLPYSQTQSSEIPFFVGNDDYVEVLDFSVSFLLVNMLKSFRQASAPDTKREKFYSEGKRAHYINVKHRAAGPL